MKCFTTNTPILPEWIGCTYQLDTRYVYVHDMFFYQDMIDMRSDEIEAHIACRERPIYPAAQVSFSTGVHGGRGEDKESVRRKTRYRRHTVGSEEWFDVIREELNATVVSERLLDIDKHALLHDYNSL